MGARKEGGKKEERERERRRDSNLDSCVPSRNEVLFLRLLLVFSPPFKLDVSSLPSSLYPKKSLGSSFILRLLIGCRLLPPSFFLQSRMQASFFYRRQSSFFVVFCCVCAQRGEEGAARGAICGRLPQWGVAFHSRRRRRGGGDHPSREREEKGAGVLYNISCRLLFALRRK